MRSRLDKLLPSGSFLRNVTILVGGTAFAQGLMVLGLPILTRLYTPDAFSLLAVYTAIIALVTVISSLRYNLAIPLPKKDVDGLALLAVSLIAAFFVTLLCAVPVIFKPDWVAAQLGRPDLQPYLWMIPFGIFIASAYNALQYWASRKKLFALITRTRMTRAIGGIGTQIGFGAVYGTPFGLIFGHMIYGGLGMIELLRSLLKNDRHLFKSFSLKRITTQARIHRRFPIYSVPASLLDTASNELPIILIASIVVGPEAGFIFLARRVVGLPMSLIGSSVSQVYLSEAPQKLRDGTLSAFTLRTMWALLKTGAPALILLGLISPIVFPLIFGQEWARSGWLVAWMTPWFILQFAVSPVSRAIEIKNKFALSLALNLIGFTLRTMTVWIVLLIKPEIAGEAFAVAGAIYFIIYTFAVLYSIDYKPGFLKKPFTKT